MEEESVTKENKYGYHIWNCKPCNWFIYPGALKFQESLGIQSFPWRCPECNGILEEGK